MTAPIRAGLLPKIVTAAAALLAISVALWLSPTKALAYMKIEALNGADSSPTPLYDRFQNDPSFIGNVINASGVAQAFQNVSGQTQDWATMISPSYFISAWHEHPGGTFDSFATYDPNKPTNYDPGNPSTYNPLLTIRFQYSNDQSAGFEDYSNNPADTGPSGSDANLKGNFTVVGHIGNGDLWLGKLNTPVSSQVAKYPILATTSSTATGNFYNNSPTMYTFGVGTGGTSNLNGVFGAAARVGRNQIDHKILSGGSQSVFPDLTDLGATLNATTTGLNFRWMYGPNMLSGFSHSDLGADESMVNGGDSGAPDFISLSPYSTAAIVGVNWFQLTNGSTGTGSGSTFVPGYVSTGKPTQFSLSTLESAMYGSGEQPSLVYTDPTQHRGDFTLDGVISVADVQAMLSALSDLPSYEQLHGVSASYVTAMGDFNGDGFLTSADIQGLIGWLANHGGGQGGGSVSAVPEPASLVLLALGILFGWRLAQRKSVLQRANLAQ